MSSASHVVTVRDRDPKVDDTLLHEGRRWDITDYSTYQNNQGYAVEEWCCELSDTEAYLLKENEEGKIRWFFTRWFPQNTVQINGQSLSLWLKQHPVTIHWAAGKRVEGSSAPARIEFKGEHFSFAESVVGDYEEDPGDSESKTTWEYWDAAHERNVALEVWENGEVDVYQGVYVKPELLRLKPRPLGLSSMGNYEVENVDAITPIVFVVMFFLMFLLAVPFDESMTVVLPAVAVFVAYLCAKRSLVLGVISVAFSGAGFFVYRLWAPLTTPIGLAVTLGLPALLSWIAVRRDELEPPRVPRLLAGFAVGFPTLLQGLIIYFSYAPNPRTVGVWILSWGVSVVVGMIGYGMAWLVARPRTPRTSDVPTLIS